jgi:hypothetical protein
MKKCSAFILLACVFGLLTTERVAAAPVTWDFQATSCSNFGGAGCVAAQQYPALLATLTLPGPDSAGSAFWAVDPVTPPVYTGDSFVLDFSARYRPLSPAFAGNGGNRDGCGPKQICDFNLSWTETAGQLTALSIDVEAFSDGFGIPTGPGGVFGLHGGAIGSDDTYFGLPGARLLAAFPSLSA